MDAIHLPVRFKPLDAPPQRSVCLGSPVPLWSLTQYESFRFGRRWWVVLRAGVSPLVATAGRLCYLDANSIVNALILSDNAS